MGEIGKSDDALPTNSQHLVNNQMGRTQRLQRMSHDNNVKTVAFKISQSLVEILFDHIQPSRYTLSDMIFIDLNTNTAHLFFDMQRVQ